MARPAVTAWIVRRLLRAETGDEGGVDVDLARAAGSECREQPDAPVDQALRERI